MCQLKCIAGFCIFLISVVAAVPNPRNDYDDNSDSPTRLHVPDDEVTIHSSTKPDVFQPRTSTQTPTTKKRTTTTPPVETPEQKRPQLPLTLEQETESQSIPKDGGFINYSNTHITRTTVPNDTRISSTTSNHTTENLSTDNPEVTNRNDTPTEPHGSTPDIRETRGRMDEGPPAMIEIPATQQGILELQEESRFQNHPGLKAAQDAINNKRSPRNAYILCIGLAGAGKSSTINFLFGRNIASVGETISTKSEIVEYSANVPIPELWVNNTQLRIIDTPGLGSEQDARLLASLNNYLTNHEDLKDSLPNVVLIFSKFDDNRMQGISSTFVKMLKGYNMVRGTFVPPTGEPTNIVYVLTRLLSETKKVQRKPEERIRVFKDVIQTYTTFPEPIEISLAENGAEEEELPKIRDDYKLPNKELYPQNLINKIRNVSTNDRIASAIFKSAFENRLTLDITKMAPIKMMDGNDDSVHDMRRLIEARDFPIHPSEVTDALKDADDKIDPDLRKSYPAALQLLQRAFQTRNIKNITQIPTKRSDVVTFLQGSNMNPAMIAIFQKAFSLEIPEYEFALVTGHGYDVLRDESLESTPFVFEDLKFSKLGFMVPNGLTAEPMNEEVNVLNLYTNVGEYMTARVRELGLQEDIKEDNYEAEFRPGYNVIDAKSKLPELSVTSIREIRKFQLVLNEKVPFNQEFQDAIAELPVFSINDRDSVSEWTSLFKKYGTHVVESAYGGGEIETIIEVTNEDLRNLRGGQTDEIQNAISKLPQNSDYSTEFQNTLTDSQISIHLRGGDIKFSRVNLAEIELSSIIANVEEWKQTLGYQSVMQKSKLQLKPLSDIVKQLNVTVAIEMQKAGKAYLEGTLEYVPPPTPPPTQQSQAEIDESQLEIIRSMNRTLTDLSSRAAVERKAREDAQEIFRKMMTTTTTTTTTTPRPRRTYTWPDRTIAPPTAPPTDRQSMMSRGADYLRDCISAVSQGSSKLREKLVRMYHRLVGNRMTDEELRIENLRRIVDAAKQEEQPTSQPETTATVLSNIKGVGHGYDLIHERPLRKTPFELTGDSYTRKKVTNSHLRISYVINVFDNIQRYINYRAQTTKSNIYFKSSEFKGTLIPGHTKSKIPDTIVKEYKEWCVTLNNPLTLSFNYEFISAINALSPYRPNDCNSVQEWRRHFNEYGTHVINSAYIGGAIEFSPYGTFMNEVRGLRLREMAYLFDTVRLEDKQVMCRVIGGDSRIITREAFLGHRHINEWAATIESNSVLLPTDIKLIPIYRLISQARANFYHDYLKAFNAYLEGKFDDCGNGIECDSGKCSCPSGQKLIKGHCKTTEGLQCSVDTWDDCAPNSACVKLNDKYGSCRCRKGFQKNSQGLCFKPYGYSCFDNTQCDADEGLLCFSDTCTCAQGTDRYDYSRRTCLARLGDKCGIHNWWSVRFNFVCKDEFACHPESQTCV